MSKELYIVDIPVEVVSKNWEFFSYYLGQALPDYSTDNEARSGNLFSSILAGRAKLFSVHEKGAGIQSLFLLGRSTDPITGDIYLVLIAMVSIESITEEVMHKMHSFMVEEVKRLGCRKLVTFTKLESVKKVAMSMGASSCYMLTLEV